MRVTIGLMSGTSLDGVDAAWVETDGERVARFGPALTVSYAPTLRDELRALLATARTLHGHEPALLNATAALTQVHAEAVAAVRDAARTAGLPDATLLGFHGQTILHDPARARTWQIGDAVALSRMTGLPVAHDFRSADVAAGGQGAPLVPIAHAVFAHDLPKPLAVLNLGGVGNVTWIGADGGLLGFDTGPANGPLDDLARRTTGAACDRDGRLALAGVAHAGVLASLLAHPYVAQPPPKSLDRLSFDAALTAAGLDGLTPPDAAATLVGFIAGCVAAAARHLPAPPRQWLVGGGGRHNLAILAALAAALSQPVRPVEAVGWDGDALEAQAFAVLAMRVVRGLPLTFPGTTGVRAPLAGGRITAPT